MKLEEVCRLFIDGDWIESKDQSHSGIRLIQTGNVGKGQFLEKEGKEKYISEAAFERLKCTEIYGGDILISRLPDPIGRACIVPNKNERMITAVDCTICRVNDNLILPRYLCYFLQSSGYYNQLHNSVAGTTRQRISRKNLGKVEIVIPSFEMQNKIVSKLDILTRLISDFSEILLKLDLLVKSRFVEMFGDTECNKKGYPIHQLSELCTVSSSKRIYQSELSNFGIPFFRISNLVELIDTKHFTSDLFISEEKYDELFANRLVPNKGDILVTSRGTLGRCYIVQKDDRFYFQDGMISWLYDFKGKVNPLYLAILFDTRDIKRQIDNLQSGSTVAYLSIAMLKKINIVVPPLELQNEFSVFVAQVDKLKAAVQKALEETQTLFDSLMQEYFG